MSVANTIESKLREALNPSSLEVIDDSHHHAGHMGASPAGETHFICGQLQQILKVKHITQCADISGRYILKILLKEKKG
jgi:hypothetical protein